MPIDSSATHQSTRELNVLFIGGTGRNGSTLLGRLLSQHKEVCFVGELDHLVEDLLRERACSCGVSVAMCPFWSRVGESAFGGWGEIDLDKLSAIGRRVVRHRNVHRMVLRGMSPKYWQKAVRILEFVEAVLKAIKQQSGASVIADSSKVARWAFLLQKSDAVNLTPILLVRDSRGVAFSSRREVMRRDFGPRPEMMHRFHPLRTALWWNAQNVMLEAFGWMYGGIKRVRYEDFVLSPTAVCRDLLAMTGCSEAGLRNVVAAEQLVSLERGHILSSNPMRTQEGHVDLSLDDRWKTMMLLRHRFIVSAMTLPLLKAYGYALVRGRRVSEVSS